VKLLINSTFIMPVGEGISPLEILTNYYTNSMLPASVPFAQWISDLIVSSKELASYPSDLLQEVVDNTLRNNDELWVVVKKIFPYQYDLKKENWEKISNCIRNMVERKAGPKSISVRGFAEHQSLFEKHLNVPIKI
jgi:hypothetical protein